MIISLFKSIKNKYLHHKHNSNNENKIAYLKSKGASIGGGTRFNCTTDAFGTEPYLISIGENCLFAAGVQFFTHDGGVCVLNNLDYFEGKKMDKIASIKVGNNVYIGTGAMIMPGITVGNNCVIGAGAIVSRDIPDNCVAVGIPAKPIKSIDEYYKSAMDRSQLYPTIGMNWEEKRNYIENITG